MKKIKILHIIKSLGRGGAEMLLPETLAIHNKEKFEFHYIYFLPWKNQLVDSIKNQGGKVTCLPANNNLQLLSKYKLIAKYVKDNQIDLIHAHLPWAGFVSRFVHKKNGIPVIYTEHNMQERYHIATKLLNKWTYNWQSLAIAVSSDVKKSIVENIKPSIPVQTLLNGVNTDKFKQDDNERSRIRKALNIPQDATVIGNVAVFRFQKRLVEWLQLQKQITDKFPGVYGILVGAGPLEEEIKKELYRLKLEDKVFLPGLQTDVKPYMSAMDIFMMSSEFEGLPIALLEAMSMETAVVTTDAGGIKELIRHEKDGLICDVEQWKDLENLAGLLLEDRELLDSYKQKARQRVIEQFSLNKMVERLEEVYLQNLLK